MAAALKALKEMGLEIISEAVVLVVVVHVVIVKGTEAAADVKAVVAFIPKEETKNNVTSLYLNVLLAKNGAAARQIFCFGGRLSTKRQKKLSKSLNSK